MKKQNCNGHPLAEGAEGQVQSEENILMKSKRHEVIAASIIVRGRVGVIRMKSVSLKPSGTGCKYDFDVLVDGVEGEKPENVIIDVST